MRRLTAHTTRPAHHSQAPPLVGFLRCRQLDVMTLMDHLMDGDFQTVKDIGHKVKGSGVVYGFPVISDIGHELESAAILRDQARVKEAIERLSDVTCDIPHLFRAVFNKPSRP